MLLQSLAVYKERRQALANKLRDFRLRKKKGSGWFNRIEARETLKLCILDFRAVGIPKCDLGLPHKIKRIPTIPAAHPKLREAPFPVHEQPSKSGIANAVPIGKLFRIDQPHPGPRSEMNIDPLVSLECPIRSGCAIAFC